MRWTMTKLLTNSSLSHLKCKLCFSSCLKKKKDHLRKSSWNTEQIDNLHPVWITLKSRRQDLCYIVNFFLIQFDSLISWLVWTLSWWRYTNSCSFVMVFLFIIFVCALCENILETHVFYSFNLKEEKIRKVSFKFRFFIALSQ